MSIGYSFNYGLITKKREELGFTLKQLAEICSINEEHLVLIENGNITYPNAYAIFKIVEALKLNFIDLLGDNRIARNFQKCLDPNSSWQSGWADDAEDSMYTIGYMLSKDPIDIDVEVRLVK